MLHLLANRPHHMTRGARHHRIRFRLAVGRDEWFWVRLGSISQQQYAPGCCCGHTSYTMSSSASGSREHIQANHTVGNLGWSVQLAYRIAVE